MEAKEIAKAEIARQAEFGYEPSWGDFVIAGQKAGIREVVVWIKEHRKITETDLYIGKAAYIHYDILEGGLQAKLKEWGIDND